MTVEISQSVLDFYHVIVPVSWLSLAVIVQSLGFPRSVLAWQSREDLVGMGALAKPGSHVNQ